MGGAYEVTGSAVKKYYSIAGMMVATQDASGLQYLLTDHLGSTVAVTNSSGTLTSQQRYLPFGAPRTIPNSPILGTDFGYTGQRLLDSGMGGIMDYKARFYSPCIMQFHQPDRLIPEPYNPQSLNRYSYVRNNPIRYNDPSGNVPIDCYDGSRYCRPTPKLVSRPEWGASEPGSIEPLPNAPFDEPYYSVDRPDGYQPYSGSLEDTLDTIVIHHEGDEESMSVKDLQRIEMERGFYDLPYHFIVGQDGTIYEGRLIAVRGAHVPGFNTGKIGILWVGDFSPGLEADPTALDPSGDDPSPTLNQINATKTLIVWLDDLYGIDGVAAHIDYGGTVCPGANAIPSVNQLKIFAQNLR